MKSEREPDSRGNTEGWTGLGPRQREVLNHAIDTFGSFEKARHWLQRPNAVLGGIPLELVEERPEAVDDELTRIDHGIYA